MKKRTMPTNFLRFTPIGLAHLMPDPVTGSTTVSSENVNASSSCQPPRRSELDQSTQGTDFNQRAFSDDMIWPQVTLNRQSGLRRQLSLPHESVLIFVCSPQLRRHRSRNDFARIGSELRVIADSFEINANESPAWMETIAALSKHILLLIVPNLVGIRFQNPENATFFPRFLAFTTMNIFIRYLRARQRRSRIPFMNGNQEPFAQYSRLEFWKDVFTMLLLNIPRLLQLFDHRNR